ncbi:MAG: hypothetical protein AAF721_07735 [Myxococcota bacterium]
MEDTIDDDRAHATERLDGYVRARGRVNVSLATFLVVAAVALIVRWVAPARGGDTALVVDALVGLLFVAKWVAVAVAYWAHGYMKECRGWLLGKYDVVPRQFEAMRARL